MITCMWNLIFRYLYDRLVANEHLHMFGFVEPSLISQLGATNARVDEQAIALTNRFQSAPKGVLLFVPYNIR